MPAYPNAPTQWGNATALDISAATVVKASAGVALIVQVITAGSAGAIYDSTKTTGNSTTNQVAAIPATVGPVIINMPCAIGIVVAPGTGQVVAVSYA